MKRFPGASRTARRRRWSSISASCAARIVVCSRRHRGRLHRAYAIHSAPRALARGRAAARASEARSRSARRSRSSRRCGSASTRASSSRCRSSSTSSGRSSRRRSTQHKQRVVVGLAAFAAFLAAGGLAFGYFVALPAAVHYLTNYDVEALRHPDPGARTTSRSRRGAVRGGDRLRGADRHPRPRPVGILELGEAPPEPPHRLRDHGGARGRASRRRPGHDDDGDGAR